MNIPSVAAVRPSAALTSADIALVMRLPKPMLPPPSLPHVWVAPGHDEEGAAGVWAALLPPKRPLTPAAAAAALPKASESLDILFDRGAQRRTRRAPALELVEAY